MTPHTIAPKNATSSQLINCNHPAAAGERMAESKPASLFTSQAESKQEPTFKAAATAEPGTKCKAASDKNPALFTLPGDLSVGRSVEMLRQIIREEHERLMVQFQQMLQQVMIDDGPGRDHLPSFSPAIKEPCKEPQFNACTTGTQTDESLACDDSIQERIKLDVSSQKSYVEGLKTTVAVLSPTHDVFKTRVKVLGKKRIVTVKLPDVPSSELAASKPGLVKTLRTSRAKTLSDVDDPTRTSNLTTMVAGRPMRLFRFGSLAPGSDFRPPSKPARRITALDDVKNVASPPGLMNIENLGLRYYRQSNRRLEYTPPSGCRKILAPVSISRRLEDRANMGPMLSNTTTSKDPPAVVKIDPGYALLTDPASSEKSRTKMCEQEHKATVSGFSQRSESEPKGRQSPKAMAREGESTPASAAKTKIETLQLPFSDLDSNKNQGLREKQNKQPSPTPSGIDVIEDKSLGCSENDVDADGDDVWEDTDNSFIAVYDTE